MTQKDYVALAVAICRVRDVTNHTAALMFPGDVIDLVVDEMAHIFAMDNPRFDKAKFVEAATL